MILRGLFSILLVVLLIGCAHRPIQLIVSGELHGPQYWDGVVEVAGDLILAEGSVLTIAPGTRIRFHGDRFGLEGWVDHPNFPGSELIVRGRIKAIGTPEQPILFEADEPGAKAGYWGAVNIEGSPEAIFEYCIFRQADSAIHSRESHVYIEQSLFEQNLVGIRFHSSEILIENNLLRNNETGIRFHFGSPVICNNRFEENGVNLFITSHPRDYRFESNRFARPGRYHVVLGEEVPENIQLGHNFWEGQTRDEVEAFFYDARRSEYLGEVLVAPMMDAPPKHNGFSWNP